MPKKVDDRLEYNPLDSLSRERIESGMYYDKAEQELYLNTAYESGRVGKEYWEQFYLTSKGRCLWLYPEDQVLIENDDGGYNGVRRAELTYVTGILGQARISESGRARAMAQERPPEELAQRLLNRLLESIALPEPWHYSFVVSWIAYTYLYALFPIAPFLAVTSTRMGSGKTSLLSFIEYLAFNASMTSTMTSAGIARSTNLFRGTLILDEMEFLGKPGCADSDMNQLINAKHTANARRITNLPCKVMGWVPTPLKMFGPLVIAKLAGGGVSPTILDRSFVIRMNKKETSRELRKPATFSDWVTFRDDLLLWAMRNHSEVLDVFENDESIRVKGNRQGDLWQVLLSIGKVFLPADQYQLLIEQAVRPEVSDDDEEVPSEYEPIIAALEACRKDGHISLKATKLMDLIGEDLAPYLRGRKSFLDALRHLELTHFIKVKPHGTGATAHVFFLPKPIEGNEEPVAV